MRKVLAGLVAIIALSGLAFSQNSNQKESAVGTYTLTVIVEGVNTKDGNMGILVFNNDKGWPEDRFAALKDVVVPAHAGTMKIAIPGLPAGTYALAAGHDVNKNHKVDKNFIGKPTEQWGMSNNPHAVIKPPAFSRAKFELKQDMEVHIQMQ